VCGLRTCRISGWTRLIANSRAVHVLVMRLNPDRSDSSSPTKQFDEAYPTTCATKPGDEVYDRSTGHTLSIHFVPTPCRLRFVQSLRRFCLSVRTRPRPPVCGLRRCRTSGWARLIANARPEMDGSRTLAITPCQPVRLPAAGQSVCGGNRLFWRASSPSQNAFMIGECDAKSCANDT